MKMLHIPVLLALAVLLPSALRAQESAPAPTQSLDEHLRTLVQDPLIPAISILLLRDGQIIQHIHQGVRSAESPTPIDASDRWHIGSCTKAMTATLAAISVTKGEINWTTTIAEALPELRDDIHQSYRDATLEQLLCHRAGVPGSGPAVQLLWGILYSLDRAEGRLAARRQAARQALNIEPIAPPGDKFEYSNLGYVIAAAMLERATDTTWEQLMQQRIFRPLAITSADFGPPPAGDDPKRPSNAVGHQNSADALRPIPTADNPRITGPGGNVSLTLQDWSRFLAAHLAGARGEHQPLDISPENFRRMHAPLDPSHDPPYAMGWGTIDNDPRWGGGLTFQHAGSNTMWYAVVDANIQHNSAVLVAANCAAPQAVAALDDIIQHAIATLINQSPKPAE